MIINHNLARNDCAAKRGGEIIASTLLVGGGGTAVSGCCREVLKVVDKYHCVTVWRILGSIKSSNQVLLCVCVADIGKY